ncbi:MAG: hypothetical protein JO267_11945 [Alphaproteobacteria bacterium]|nr:hypothetical protein [Alphaproteobacteria bacterium]
MLGFATFEVKYAVQDLEDELGRIRKQIAFEQSETRVLAAEWTRFNQPERLEELNRHFLGLTSIQPAQLSRGIAEIPLRPAPPVEAPAAVATAAATATPVPSGAATGSQNGADTRPAAVVVALDGQPAISPKTPVKEPDQIADKPADKVVDKMADRSKPIAKAAVHAPRSIDELFTAVAEER